MAQNNTRKAYIMILLAYQTHNNCSSTMKQTQKSCQTTQFFIVMVYLYPARFAEYQAQ